MKRSQGSAVEWDMPVRIRHMPSGKYLAVNTTDSTYKQINSDNESWFALYMVDDAAVTREEELSETIRCMHADGRAGALRSLLPYS